MDSARGTIKEASAEERVLDPTTVTEPETTGIFEKIPHTISEDYPVTIGFITEWLLDPWHLQCIYLNEHNWEITLSTLRRIIVVFPRKRPGLLKIPTGFSGFALVPLSGLFFFFFFFFFTVIFVFSLPDSQFVVFYRVHWNHSQRFVKVLDLCTVSVWPHCISYMLPYLLFYILYSLLSIWFL